MVDQTRTGLRCVLCWLAAFGVLAVLTVASCTSNQEFNYLYVQISELFSLSKTSLSSWLLARSEFGHFLGYAVLTVVLFGVLSFHFENRYKLLAAPMVAGVFGLLMELAQVFIPSRGASLGDMGINILGVLVGIACFLLVAGWSKRLSRVGVLARRLMR